MPPRRYAADTDVPVSKTKADIEELLTRYGATGYGMMVQGRTNAVMFEANGRRVIMRMTLPDLDSRELTYRSDGSRLSAREREARIPQTERQRWRALLLVIKAKLESVESGIETFDQAFLSHIALPDGQTIGEWIEPQVEETYRSGRMPSMIPGVKVSVIELPERAGR